MHVESWYQMAAQAKWWHLKHMTILIFVILSLKKSLSFGDFKKYNSSGSAMMQSRNIIMFIPLFILKQLYSNVLLCLFCYEVSWLYGYSFSSYSVFIKSIMIIVIFKKFFWAKIKTFLATRILKQLLYSDLNLEYIWAYLSGLLLPLKSWSISPSGFYGQLPDY